MDEEKNVTEDQEVKEEQPQGLMAEEAKTMESEDTNEEGINTHQDENVGEEQGEGEVKKGCGGAARSHALAGREREGTMTVHD